VARWSFVLVLSQPSSRDLFRREMPTACNRCCLLIRKIGIANVSRLLWRPTERADVSVTLWRFVFGLLAVMTVTFLEHISACPSEWQYSIFKYTATGPVLLITYSSFVIVFPQALKVRTVSLSSITMNQSRFAHSLISFVLLFLFESSHSKCVHFNLNIYQKKHQGSCLANRKQHWNGSRL
jgi:hypothetical protein